MSELREAIERLRTNTTSKIVDARGNIRFEHIEDLATVADAYLAENDPTPITEEWLRSVEKGMDIDEGVWKFENDDGIQVFAWNDGTINFGDTETRMKCTRGQLLKLLAALGITKGGGA